MKSLRFHSFDNRATEFRKKYSSKKEISYSDRPTPLDFDAFIPWLCLELQVSKNVIITRTNQAEYVRRGSKTLKSNSRSSKLKSKSSKFKSSSIKSDHTDNKTLDIIKTAVTPSITNVKDTIPVTAYYDKRGRLVEIAIIGCSFPINRKVIQAFNICLPFHSDLTKLSIRKGGLSSTIIYEIGKLLPYSNITEICLDDSCVLEGNYSLLLEKPGHLKYLSLKRCGINDLECKRIAALLHFNGPASKTLLLLDLTSNKIMDEGAQALGEALKSNRCLLYLNLSGNRITDDGASFILMYLKQFQLTFNDTKEKRGRRLEFLKARTSIYQKCLDEARLARLASDSKKVSQLHKDQLIPIMAPKQTRNKKNKKYVPSFIFEETSVEDDAEKKTQEIMGEFEDSFKEECVKREGNFLYAVGNLTLCSLNLAYNNLSLLTLRKILEVLKYQSEINKEGHCTGLIRIEINGNNVLYRCKELDEINTFMKKAISENEHNMSVLSLTTSVLSEKYHQ